MCNVTDMNITFSEKDCLEWAVDEIIGKAELESALARGRKLRIKLGIDPTSPNIHLGRSIPLWRLRAFQELGHEIHFIIGDFTGQIGDTSDKDAERPMLSKEVIDGNLQEYMDQVWMILNPTKKDLVHVHYNSEWLAGLGLGALSVLADSFSVNQFIKRELISKRLETGSRVSLREMLYPLMQGYDSIMVNADVEVGGTDQRFNLLAGRVLQERGGQNAQAIIMNHLVAGTDGRKMSSSWGNVITLRDSPEDKFGKVMAILDGLIEKYLLFLPYFAQPYSSEELHVRIASGENPRDLKMLLASAIVELYHGEDEARRAAAEFAAVFSQHQMPESMPEAMVGEEVDIADVLLPLSFVESKSDLRRLVEQGGVRFDGVVLTSYPSLLTVSHPGILQVGKRKFVRLIPKHD
jgi:tyrosyl-tRNA synthetase